MNILIVAATPFEITPVNNYLLENYHPTSPYSFKKGELTVFIIVTGVGTVATTYFLSEFFHQHQNINLAINAGIAGAFNKDLETGTVVNVTKECFADLGVEEKGGTFTDVFELELIHKNHFPYQDGWMENENVRGFDFLPQVSGITVNKVHGTAESIAAVSRKYKPEVESMEGGAFFYVCLQKNIPFLELRSISNLVEPRNRDNWDIPLAINRLNEVLLQIIQQFEVV